MTDKMKRDLKFLAVTITRFGLSYVAMMTTLFIGVAFIVGGNWIYGVGLILGCAFAIEASYRLAIYQVDIYKEKEKNA